ncbi:MAG: thymidylate synthase, partial [Candidatus Paceibacterota bacterium]
DENQYLTLVQEILKEGTMETGRNGKVITVFGAAMHFSLDNNTIPFLTTKKLAWKTCLRELLWFIRGQTSNNILREQNVHIWDANGSRDFLDSRGLNYEENDLGPVYGHQWRHFNAEYKDCNTDYTGQGIDQLQYIINSLKDPKERNSRRLVMSAWNPCQLNEMALPPCHILCQFSVKDGNKLSCSLYQRSVDLCVGSPINIASYCFLTHLIAHHCDLIADDFVYYMGNVHIYEDHINGANEQIFREPYAFPKLLIKNKYENINDYNLEDFEILDYKSHPLIKFKMIA